MAYSSIYYFSGISKELVDVIENDLKSFNDSFKQAHTFGGITLDKRDSKVTWIPTTHWVGGLAYHYVNRANKENFLYDISGFDNETIQYTCYEEGEYYHWHNDASIEVSYKPTDNPQENFIVSNTEQIRKLSLVIQLSDPDEYEGGELQLMGSDGQTHFAPKTRGSVIIFDSRTPHRVKKILSGKRKSLVGWVCGKRWK